MEWSGRAPARWQANLARGAKVKEHAMSQQLSATIAVIGIVIGKNSFHVVGLDQRGAIVLRQKWSRGQVESRLANMAPWPSCPRSSRVQRQNRQSRRISWRQLMRFR